MLGGALGTGGKASRNSGFSRKMWFGSLVSAVFESVINESGLVSSLLDAGVSIVSAGISDNVSVRLASLGSSVVESYAFCAVLSLVAVLVSVVTVLGVV